MRRAQDAVFALGGGDFGRDVSRVEFCIRRARCCRIYFRGRFTSSIKQPMRKPAMHTTTVTRITISQFVTSSVVVGAASPVNLESHERSSGSATVTLDVQVLGNTTRHRTSNPRGIRNGPRGIRFSDSCPGAGKPDAASRGSALKA